MPRRRRLAALALLALLLVTPGPASAEIGPAQVIDGPSGDIVEVGGAATASDGTGGIVYLKRVGGRTQVFVARYVRGRWWPPIPVGADLPYDSSWPRIGAGADGRLVVVFAHAFEQGNLWLWGATLEPGAAAFTPALEIDTDLGPGGDLYPDVAVNDGGRAYVSYRVARQGSAIRAGDIVAETRVARLNGRHWSRIGQVNRRPGVSVRRTTPGNAPKLTIDREGNGLVAFQEPDDELVDRIWARRLFGGAVGRILAVSPSAWDDAPLRGEADAFEVGGAGLGAAAVAFRQQPGPGSPFQRPRVMVNTIPVGLDEKAAEFRGAKLADGDAPAGSPSPPAVAMDPDERLSVAFAAGDGVTVASGELGGIAASRSLRSPHGVASATPSLTLGASGALTAAWPVEVGAGAGAIAVSEIPAAGSAQSALVSAPIGGPVADLGVGGSGFGDAIVGFRQGAGPTTQVVGAVVDVAPAPFAVTAPQGWVRPAKGRVTWAPAVDAFGAVSYQPVLDGQTIARVVSGRAYRFDRRRLSDGVHRVEIVARDARKQATVSRPALLRVDGTPPSVTVAVNRRRVTVRVGDGRRGRVSGVRAGGTTVTFGDGARSARRGSSVRHTYRRAGRYRVVVTARDRVGNAVRSVRSIRVR